MTKTFIIDKDSTPRVTLRDGFIIANNYGEYLDVDREIFSFRREGDTEEYDSDSFIIQRITFVRPDGKSNGNHYESAYITHTLNVPSGNHSDCDHQINVTVEEAMRLCFKEC